MKDTMFLPFYSTWRTCAPCENDTSYLHRVIQGQVSDGNAYALGGIAGHAGLFSTALDLSTLMYRLMFAEENDTFLNKTTVQYFIREYNHSQSSRALGWNTNDPTVFGRKISTLIKVNNKYSYRLRMEFNLWRYESHYFYASWVII